MRFRLSPVSFHDEPNRDYVLTMNVLLAACIGVASAMYTPLAWWSIAVGAGALAMLERSARRIAARSGGQPVRSVPRSAARS
jgi:hypothetical protein